MSEIEKSTNHVTLNEKEVDGGGGRLTYHLIWPCVEGGNFTKGHLHYMAGGGEPHLSSPFYMGGELTWDEIHQSIYMMPNIVHLILAFLCFSYYLAPHAFPLILMMLNITMFIYKNFTKIKKTYNSMYQIWSEKPSVHKLSKKEKIRKDISYVTGKDINPFTQIFLYLSNQFIKCLKRAMIQKFLRRIH